MSVLNLLVYASLLVFLVAVIARIIRIVKMPVHLRWELYPLPHEKGRASYGGSIMEEVDWWTKSREHSQIGTLAAMIPEIIFLKGVWEHNRSLWFGSWTLHFGLYLLIGELCLLVLAGIFQLTGISDALLGVVLSIVPIFAWVGCILGLIGVAVMSVKRLTDRKLKMYTNTSHILNLLLLGAIYLTGLLWIAGNAGYSGDVASVFAAWMTLASAPALPAMGYWHIGFVLFFLVYFPFTHMTHAFVKYFTYHDIRWEDTPNVAGGKLGKKIEKLVNQPVTWAAPHINADGRKTWADIATESGEEKQA
jgi:nitrate reductase gamma subunit